MSEIFGQFGIWSLIDIAIISFIVYQMFMLLQGTHAAQMLKGIIVVVVSASALLAFAPLTALNWLMNKFYPSFIVILVILFQDDFRRMLRTLGKRSFAVGAVTVFAKQELVQISEAISILAQRRIGALVVIERDIVLNQYINMGVSLDARISKDLLVSIFQPTSPIHDGAVAIQGGRVSAAGCLLPLTKHEKIASNFGTRHRAALGVSQETDAAVVVVSEERGSISWVADGKVDHDIDLVTLEGHLGEIFIEEGKS